MTGNRSFWCGCTNLFLDEHVNFVLRSNEWEATKEKIKNVTTEEDKTALYKSNRKCEIVSMWVSDVNIDSL